MSPSTSPQSLTWARTVETPLSGGPGDACLRTPLLLWPLLLHLLVWRNLGEAGNSQIAVMVIISDDS